MATKAIVRSTLSVQEANSRRRRLSNLFDPPVKEEETTLVEENNDTSIFIDESSEENTPLEENINENSPSSSLFEESASGMEETSEEPVQLRRSQRKRFRSSLSQDQIHVKNKIVKLNENSSLSDIKNYYLDKNVKRLKNSLETIYEEPQTINDEDVVMSSRKFRRVIDFKNTASKNGIKARKRKVKVKKLQNNKKIKKVTMKVLMNKLDEVEQE